MIERLFCDGNGRHALQVDNRISVENNTVPRRATTGSICRFEPYLNNNIKKCSSGGVVDTLEKVEYLSNSV